MEVEEKTEKVEQSPHDFVVVLTNFVGGPDDFVVGSQKSSIFKDEEKIE
jgi:hypothetical protein